MNQPLLYLIIQTRQMSTQYLHYCSIFFMLLSGFYVASYGPLIPFYTKATAQDETYFSFIFMVRSIANILGGIVIKYLLRTFRIKVVIMGMGIFMGLSLIICSLSVSTVNLVITLFISSINFTMMSIIVISFNFILYGKDEAQKKIQILGFTFGVGAIIGPFVIMFLQLATYRVFGLSVLLLIPLYLNCNPPQINNQNELSNQTDTISYRSQMLICSMMLLYATLQLGMGSWIPTYAIKAGVSTTQHSGIYSLLFWLPNCIFRLLWIYVPLDFHRKLKLIIYTLAVTTFICLVLQSMGYYQAVCIFGPISSGLLLSNLYAFFIALPSQSGYQFSSSNSANFVVANCLGQGILLTPMGYAMNWLGFKSLMVMQCLFGVVMFMVYDSTMQSLERGRQPTSIKLIGHQN